LPRSHTSLGRDTVKLMLCGIFSPNKKDSQLCRHPAIYDLFGTM